MAEVQDNGNSESKTPGAIRSTGIGIQNTERRSKLYNITSTITDLNLVNTSLSGRLVQLKIPLRKNSLQP